MSAAGPSQGAKALSGGSDPHAVGARGGYTTPLALQQQAVLAALLGGPQDAIKLIAVSAHGYWARGLNAYQGNAHALARRSLRAAYPVLARLLGEESFEALACALWHAQPPQRGDMALWGEALPAFVTASAQLADEPYLADVARAEWALHRAATAADAEPELATLALLTAQAPEQLALRLVPGTAVLVSAYPVASIITAHLEASPTLPEAGQRLRAGLGEAALVWRQGYKPRLRATLPGEAPFVAALLAGAPLATALAQAGALDFARWLALAVQSGLLLAIERLAPDGLAAAHPDALISTGDLYD